MNHNYNENIKTKGLEIIIHTNNSLNDSTRAVPHSYKVCNYNIWSPTGLLCPLQPLPDRLVASLPQSSVQVREWVEQVCLPVRDENTL